MCIESCLDDNGLIMDNDGIKLKDNNIMSKTPKCYNKHKLKEYITKDTDNKCEGCYEFTGDFDENIGLNKTKHKTVAFNELMYGCKGCKFNFCEDCYDYYTIKRENILEHKLFNAYLKYMTKINSIHKRINPQIYRQYIKWFEYFTSKNIIQLFMFIMNEIISKDYHDKYYLIRHYFINNNDFRYDHIMSNRDHGQKMFLVSPLFINKNRSEYTLKHNISIYDHVNDLTKTEDIIMNENLINQFLVHIRDYTRYFYDNVINKYNKKCKQCGSIMKLYCKHSTKMNITCYKRVIHPKWEHLNREGWLNGNSFVYPWNIDTCYICGAKLVNQSIKHSNSIALLNLDNVSSNESCVARLVKILSGSFINSDGSYNYGYLFDVYLKDKSRSFNDILNAHDEFIKMKLSYKKLMAIKATLPYCNLNQCKHLSDIYRNRTRNNHSSANIKRSLINKIHMSLHHFSLHKKRHRNYNDINATNTNDNKFTFNFNIDTKDTNDDNAIKTLINNNNYVEYSFGDSHGNRNTAGIEIGLEYYMIPKIKYTSFYEEMLSNKICSVTSSDWITELEKSKLFINKNQIQSKHANQGNKCELYTIEQQNNTVYYGVIYGDRMDIKNILCILFYTGYSVLCNKFRQEFYQNEYTKYSKKYTKRKFNGKSMTVRPVKSIEYYWFGYLLFQTIEYFSDTIDKTQKISFYHGLNKRMVFNSYKQTFNIPLSVTNTKNVAENFSTKNGIILQLKSTYKPNDYYFDYKWNDNTRFISVALLSDFGEFEDESIYFGVNNKLLIYNIIDRKNEMSLYKYIKCINWLQAFIDGIGYYFTYKYLNYTSLILNNFEKNRLNIMLDCAINVKNKKNILPKYLYHLFLYFCLKRDELNFRELYKYKFIYEYKEILTLILDDGYKPENLFQIYSNKNNKKLCYFPVSHIKIKRIFKNINKYKDINGKTINLNKRSSRSGYGSRNRCSYSSNI